MAVREALQSHFPDIISPVGPRIVTHLELLHCQFLCVPRREPFNHGVGEPYYLFAVGGKNKTD